MILQNVPPSLRGELSRWMLEPKVGVFVGRVSARVRDRLWEKCIALIGEGSVIQIWSSPSEQGFQIRALGDSSRSIVDLDGLILVKMMK